MVGGHADGFGAAFLGEERSRIGAGGEREECAKHAGGNPEERRDAAALQSPELAAVPRRIAAAAPRAATTSTAT